MDLWEFIVVVIVLLAIILVVYYYTKGAKGDIALSRPVESRVDEYLDRRFAQMVDEWELVSNPRLRTFKDQHIKEIEGDEARILELKNYESWMQTTLGSMEARLDTLEKELAKKGSPKE